MPGIMRQGDTNVRGGVISSSDASVRVNGVPIAVKDSRITPYNIGKKRIVNAVTTGTSSVQVNGRSITLSTDPDSYGTPMTGGSTNVTSI